MKLAICLKGHIRNMTVVRSIQALSETNEVDVYISTYDDLGFKCSECGQKDSKRGTILMNSGKTDLQDIVNKLNPQKVLIENYLEVEQELDYVRNTYFFNWLSDETGFSPDTILSQMRQRYLSVHLIDNIESYDYVLVTRPDVTFRFFSGLPQDIPENSLGITVTSMAPHKRDATWFDDLVLIGKPKTMLRMADMYKEIPIIMEELKQKDLKNVAMCMHQIQGYMFEDYANMKLVGCDGLHSSVTY